MIKHRRERRRSAAVQHGEQRLYLTKRSSPGNIEQTVPSYSIRLFSLNLVHLARVSIRTIFSYRSRSSFRYTKLPKLFIYKKKLGKREREREFSNEISIENRGERNSRRNRRDAPKRRGCGGGGASGLCST